MAEMFSRLGAEKSSSCASASVEHAFDLLRSGKFSMEGDVSRFLLTASIEFSLREVV
jgi:hypothetical protein